MTKFLKTQISFLVLLIALASPVRSQSMTTFFSYDFNGILPPPTLSFQGTAHLSTYLRLTATDASGVALPFSIGRAVHSTPIILRTQGIEADYETTLKFLITAFDSSPADGLTFFIAPVDYPIPAGSTGGNFGIFNPSTDTTTYVFAVEFDTMQNAWDPGYRHVGIDIESSGSRNVTRVDNAIIGQEATARISYVAATKLISVRVSAGGQNFEVSYVHDLNTVLPDQVQVGISAATGERVALHEVISWEWRSTINFGQVA